MVGGDQNTTLYSSSSSISPGPGAAPATTSSSSPSRRSARDSQYVAAATAERGGGEVARRGRPPATVRGRGDAAEVEAPPPPSPDEVLTARLVRRRRFLPGGFRIIAESFSSSSRAKPIPVSLFLRLVPRRWIEKRPLGLSKSPQNLLCSLTYLERLSIARGHPMSQTTCVVSCDIEDAHSHRLFHFPAISLAYK
jgi:hypothetical protein